MPNFNRREVEQGVTEMIEQARRAQQENEQQHDVQQEIPAWDENAQTDWQQTAADLASGDLARIKAHIPPYLTDCDPGDEHFDR